MNRDNNNKGPGGKDVFLSDYGHQVLKIFALANNYNSWVYELISPYLSGKILEVGCGVGNLTMYFRASYKVTCIDKSRKYVEHMKIDNPGMDCHVADICEENIFGIIKEKFDTAVCANVLEHIEDDRKAIRNIYGLLKPGGRFVLFVPACSRVYGKLDEKLEHFKRYDRKEVLELMRGAGFSVESISYCNLIGLFGWYFNSKMLRRESFSIIQTLLYDKLIPLVAKIESKITIPAGLSLLAVGKKPE